MAWLVSVGAWAFAAAISMNFALSGQLRDEICTVLYLIAFSALGTVFVASRLNRRYVNNILNKRGLTNANELEIEEPYESSRDNHSIDQLDRNALIQREHLWAVRMSAENAASTDQKFS